MSARLVLTLLVVLAWPASAHAQAVVATVPGDLGDVTVGASSARVYLPVTNTGPGLSPLDVTAVAFDPPTTEFDVLASDCIDRDVPAGGSCFLGVRFLPAADGVRTATLIVTGNQSPSSTAISLTGRGVAPATGPQGPPGAPGTAGPGGPAGSPGATGPQGRPGRAIQATCTTKGKPPKTSCRIVVLPDDVAAASVRVRLIRAGKTVARGSAPREGRVKLRSSRRVRAGRYTLAVTFKVDGRTVRARQAVRLR